MRFPQLTKCPPSRLYKSYSSSVAAVRTVPQLADGYSIETFRSTAFEPEVPVMFPRGNFASIPAISRWFQPLPDAKIAQTSLNMTHLFQYKDTNVPMELTLPASDGNVSFELMDRPLGEFVALVVGMQHTSPEASASTPNVYIAQCSLSRLPSELQSELPTPEVVTKAGRGDLYDSSIWIGRAPTYTPLHKDPNPNVFVQLAGQKTVRLFEPELGKEIFQEAERRAGTQGNDSFRGEEMMQGKQRQILEDIVWCNDSQYSWVERHSSEIILGPGDGAFIPKGWWHSVKGTGNGVVGSVNWWFR